MMEKRCTPGTFIRGLTHVFREMAWGIRETFVAQKLKKREVIFWVSALLGAWGAVRINELWLLEKSMTNILVDVPLQLFGAAFYIGVMYGVYKWLNLVSRGVLAFLKGPKFIWGSVSTLVIFTGGVSFLFVASIIALAYSISAIKIKSTAQLLLLQDALKITAEGSLYTLAVCVGVLAFIGVVSTISAALRRICEAGQQS